jgi:hypothetical protein
MKNSRKIASPNKLIEEDNLKISGGDICGNKISQTKKRTDKLNFFADKLFSVFEEIISFAIINNRAPITFAKFCH